MAKSDNPFRWFDSSPEVIRLVVMLYVKYPLSLRNVEDLLHERGIDICHEAPPNRNSPAAGTIHAYLGVSGASGRCHFKYRQRKLRRDVR